MATVLIIEDNQIVRMTLSGLLRHAGYQVVGEARDGESGLELALQLRPDVLCLDIELPGMDGLAVLKTLRARNMSLPVVIVSGRSDRETVKQLIQAGADSMVVKPFSQARLIAAIEKAVVARARLRGSAAGAGEQAVAKEEDAP